MADGSSFPCSNYNMRKGSKQPPDQLVNVKIHKSKEEQQRAIFLGLSVVLDL